jgi:hypothetical protein
LEDEEGVGDADWTFEETTSRLHVLRWVVGDEAVEGGFELAASIWINLSVTGQTQCLENVVTSLDDVPIVLEVSWRHLGYNGRSDFCDLLLANRNDARTSTS